MKKSNIMSASALFLGIVLAVATTAFTPATIERTGDVWGRDASGQYTNITQNGLVEDEDYVCNDADLSCQVSYPLGQDPNVNPTGGTEIKQGEFELIP